MEKKVMHARVAVAERHEALDHLPMPAFVIALDGDAVPRFEKMNAAMKADAGLLNVCETNKTPHHMLPPRRANGLCEAIKHCLQEGEVYTYEEVYGVGDTERWWHTTLTPVSAKDGSADAIVGIAEDISERKTGEIAQAEKSAMMRKRMNDLSLFSSVAAHDLRSPMCQLDLMLQLVMKDFKDLGDGKSQMLNTSRQVIAHGIEFLDEVLKYCSEKVGDEPIEKQIDFAQLCGELSTLLDPHARHLITYHDVSLNADATVVQIVLRNLIDNAIKHNPDITLMIDIDVHDAKGGWLIFTVQDNGQGIENAESVLASGNAGSGSFGLNGIRQLLGTRSGNLRLSPGRNGVGTKVMFSLPGTMDAKTIMTGSAEVVMRAAA